MKKIMISAAIGGGGYELTKKRECTPKVWRKKNKKMALCFLTARIFLVLFFSFFFLYSCDLMQPADPDYIAKLDAEVAWANAAKLTQTRLEYNPNWGVSNPARGALVPTFDIRQGYEFTVEFTPLSGYGFVQWLAFNGDDYNAGILGGDFEAAKAKALSKDIVEITEGQTQTGAITAAVTINSNIPVTLVPFCDQKLRVIYSNPPLTPVITAFPYDQKIAIRFSEDIQENTVILGESIRITAIYTIGANAYEPFEENGDITDYFKLSFPENYNDRIELVVKDDDDYPASKLQLLNISVEIGPDILSVKGFEMSGVQNISYLTSTNAARKVYEAANIKASRNGELYFEDYRAEWNNHTIDRRFNLSEEDSYNYNTVYLEFQVTPPNEDAPQVPNRFYIYERRHMDLSGFLILPAKINNENNGEPYEYEENDVVRDGSIYKINHKLKTEESGIIQLIVIPWNESENEAENFEAQDFAAAYTAGQYVTIVLDLSPPGLSNMGAVIEGGGYADGVYSFSQSAAFSLTFNNLGSLSDNALDGGIASNEAWNKPWTMDARKDLKWRVLIYDASTPVYTDEDWRIIYELDGVTLKNNFSIGIKDLIDDYRFELEKTYTVKVQYMDSLGNMSSVSHPSAEACKIKIIDVTPPVPVTGFSATVNDSGNLITFTWNCDPDNTGTRVLVNGSLHSAVTRAETQPQSYSISVNTIDASGVTNGNPVTGVTRYDISFVAYNLAGDADAESLVIWNIPGMEINHDEYVLIRQSNVNELYEPENLTKNIILTENITLSSHTPIGKFSLLSEINPPPLDPDYAFTGKFYGNGHTVTITGFADDAAEFTDFGLFGAIYGGMVRDATVEYDNVNVTAYTTRLMNIQYGSGVKTFGSTIGCIAGTTTKGTQIENVLIKGKIVTNTNTDYFGYIGGMVGRLEFSNIKNAHNSVTLIIGETGNIHVGGIVGNNWNASLESCLFYGLLDKNDNENSTNNEITLGGIIGYSTNENSIININNCRMRGDIIFAARNILIGGVIGYSYTSGDSTKSTNITASFFEDGDIIITGGDYSYNSYASIGGFIGYTQGNNILNNCGAIRGTIAVYFFGPIEVGGFISRTWGNISGCFSKIDIITISYGTISTSSNIGGFAATVEYGSNVEGCYAAGSIRSIHNGSEGTSGNVVYIGGFAGLLRISTINNCYALGDVLVDKQSGTGNMATAGFVYAGGLVGYIDYYSPSIISNCFSKGNVIAQSAGTAVYSGGVVGGMPIGSTSNTAALGGRVTAARNGSYALLSYRIGYPYTASVLSNNYAINSMLVGTGAYNAYIPGEPVTTTDIGANTINGADIGISETISTEFWGTTLGFNSTGSYTEYVPWDLSAITIIGRGHPLLLNPDGTRMAGQE